MKALRLVCCFLVGMMLAASPALAQFGSMAESIYQNAHRGNYVAIQRVMARGYSIDVTDANGNTALCLAMASRDSYAYGVLKKYGAKIIFFFEILPCFCIKRTKRTLFHYNR